MSNNNNSTLASKKIQLAEYIKFRNRWLGSDQLVRLGQSFCDAFGIDDNILYYQTETKKSDLLIRDKYILY